MARSRPAPRAGGGSRRRARGPPTARRSASRGAGRRRRRRSRRAGSARASPGRGRSGSGGRAASPAGSSASGSPGRTSASTPSSRQRSALKVSSRKPRSSPRTRGSIATSPSIFVSSRLGTHDRRASPVLALVVLAVLAGADRPPPLLVVAVPARRCARSPRRSRPAPSSRAPSVRSEESE